VKIVSQGINSGHIYVQPVKKGEKRMKNTLAKTLSLSLVALLVWSAMTVLPVFSGFPPRHYDRPGRGAATFYINPQDSLFESSSTTNGTWFTVNVRIANATFVASWQIELIYRKECLYTSPANISYATDMIFPPGKYISVSPVVNAFNSTHNLILHYAGSLPFQEYNATDAGLATVKFQIIKVPNQGEKLSSLLYFTVKETQAKFGSFTEDFDLYENDLTLYDGYYSIYEGALIAITIDKPYPQTYHYGETMHIKITLKNPAPKPKDVLLVWYAWLYPPYGTWVPLVVTSYTIPADTVQMFDINLPCNWGSLIWAYWIAAILDSSTMDIISLDSALWGYTPT